MAHSTIAFTIEFGALAPPLSEQLAEQGVPFDAQECARWERWHDALYQLAIKGPVTRGERQRIEDRMHKMIKRSLQQHLDSLVEPAASHSEPSTRD